MPLWRRLLCILVGLPIAIGGLSLLSGGSLRFLIPAAFLFFLGGLLAMSGIVPSRTRDY